MNEHYKKSKLELILNEFDKFINNKKELIYNLIISSFFDIFILIH